MHGSTIYKKIISPILIDSTSNISISLRSCKALMFRFCKESMHLMSTCHRPWDVHVFQPILDLSRSRNIFLSGCVLAANLESTCKRTSYFETPSSGSLRKFTLTFQNLIKKKKRVSVLESIFSDGVASFLGAFIVT